MEKEVKERNSESHPSSLEDGRVVTDFDKVKFCQSCGMPLTDEVLGTNADGSKNEDYCMYCYKDGKFLQDCTMEEMIEHCAQFVGAVNEGLPNPITKEEYIGQMKMYFPHQEDGIAACWCCHTTKSI